MEQGYARQTGRPQIFQAPVEVTDGPGRYLKRPAMTTVLRDAIRNPRAGMGIFNTDTLQEEFYDGTIWKQSAGGGGPTLMVAASNALASTIARADYQCDGVADEVEINAALAACNAGPGGRVLLSEGTFTLATPIVFPGNDLTLFGMGFNTFIDGDGLLTDNHAIELVGRTNCTLEEFSIQTEAGGGKTCHCIFLNDGCNGFRISGITIIDSDYLGIRIEGTTVTDGWIVNCEVMAADSAPISIYIDGGNYADRIHIINNTLAGGGNNSGIYIQALGGYRYFEITGNIIRDNNRCGLEVEDLEYSVIADNDVYNNGTWGIRVQDSTLNTIVGNNVHNNGGTGIRIETSDENVVTGNQVSYNNPRGIELNGSNYCTITDNVVSHQIGNGIQITGTGAAPSTVNVVSGNTITQNGGDGIEIIGGVNASGNSIEGNHCSVNVSHGINVAGEETKIEGNYCYGNSTGAAGTDHGINLAGTSDRSMVNDNYCSSEGGNQEDGIHLEDGATHIQIVGNYCYDGMGSGIALTANNTNCLIKDNYCQLNDDYGIEFTAATCINNEVMDNVCTANVTGQMLMVANNVLAHNETGADAEVHEPREATITVAAVDSLTASGDYVCDGVADDVQINAALNALPAAGGRVILLEGTYTIVDSITIPANNITLEGQGRTTFIDGDGLATTEHAIIISAVTDVTIRNLSMQTADTGGNVIHCIFIEDGANFTTIDHVTIVNSDSDGIHIEGTNTTDITIESCLIEAADEYGIFVDMDAANTMLRLRIVNNTILGAGTDGIATGVTGAGCTYAEIIGNIVAESGGRGMYLRELTYSLVNDNIVHTSTGTGILIGTSSTNNVIDSNECYNNGQQGIEVNGNATDNTVSGNACHGNTACGIEFTGASHRCTAAGNNCRTNQYGIYFESSDYGVMTGNTVSDNVEDGLYFDSSDYGTCTGNVSYDNDVGGTEYNGIWVENSNYCVISGNVFEGNGLHGIWIDRSDNCTVSGNICNNSNTGDGININGTAAYNTIADNECYGNASDGIEIVGGTDAVGNHITGNMIVENQNHGINCAGYKNKIEDNFIRHTGIGAAGTYHGIYLTATADGTQVQDNTIYDSGDATEDGIHLDDGCVSCQINGNYVYNTMGNGIRLTLNNDTCQVNNNHIQGVDDRGIWLTGSSHCTINSNLVSGSGITSIAIHTASTYNTIDSNNCEIPGAINIEVNGNCTHNTITGNNCRGATAGAGIICTGTSHACTVTGNHCDTNQYGIYIESSNDCVVTGNTAMTSIEDGIVLDNSNDCTVTGNVSTDNDTGATGCSGITVWDSHRNAVSGNTCDHNGLHGIYVYRGDYNTITGNSCNNQDTGDGIHIFGDGARNSDYNIVSSNSCTGNADDGVAIEGVGDANKNIVIGNQLLGNGGTPLVDNGTATETGHNITA